MKEQNEEVSLWEVLHFLKQVITYNKKLLKKIGLLWLGLFVVGYIYMLVSPRNYLSEMYVSSKNMNREELSSQIIYLNKLIEYNGREELALLLGLSAQEAASLVSFRIEPYIVEE
ncbi:MAG TPA: hypothetical protein VL947_02750, partial [Cytophagales bacterium]|nr:hypothetical protein [Cytophagales bacterium]